MSAKYLDEYGVADIRAPLDQSQRLFRKEFPGESLTKQMHKDECDVNQILRKFEKTGIVAHRNKFEGRYEDVSQGLDLQAALQVITEAQEMFMELPATVRREFENDPGKFLAFVQDPENAERMYELGLADRPPEKKPASAPDEHVSDKPAADASGQEGSE